MDWDRIASLVVCRCEGVSVGDIRAAARTGDMSTIKRMTRACMGQCQGRSCETLIAEILHEMQIRPVGTRMRAPLFPIPVAQIARLDR